MFPIYTALPPLTQRRNARHYGTTPGHLKSQHTTVR